MRTRAMVPALLLLWPAATGADDVELFSTDRPDVTEAAARVGRDVWQVEAGWSFTSSRDFTAQSVGDALIRIGIDDHVELRFFAPSLEWSSAGGAGRAQLGNIGAGVKIGASSSSEAIAGAVLLAYSVPTRPDVEPVEVWEMLAAADVDLPAGMGAGLNLGTRMEGNAGSPLVHFPFASLSVGRELSKRASIFLELIGEGGPGARWSGLMDTGGSLAIAPGLQIDGSVGRALDRDAEWFGGMGASKRW